MLTAYFDCFAGISGDMLIGALLDLGLDFQIFQDELRKLPVEGYRLEAKQVLKNGIRAVSFAVILEDGVDRLADSAYVEVGFPGEELDRQHQLVQSEHSERHQTARTLPDILQIIQASTLSDSVKARSERIFFRLAEAESKVHGSRSDLVHFHEVGGVDAIIDIVGACIGLELLGIGAVYASPLHLGGGFVKSAHGMLPVPAPATAELLVGAPVYTSQTKGELVTPTGAAILTAVADGFGPLPPMKVKATGYGAGMREREFPNVLRVILGDPNSILPNVGVFSPTGEWRTFASLRMTPGDVGENGRREPRDPHPEQHAVEVSPAGYHSGQVTVIEANLDDMQPQLFENLMDRLLAQGALDVLHIPAQMKKNRPGVLLQVLAQPGSEDELLEIIFRESTTIGVRTYPAMKHMLQRKTVNVETRYGPVRVKLSYLGDQPVNISPEYEDCRSLANKTNIPLKEIMAEAIAACR